MKVVALISGGKDSCYTMVQCVIAGHEIVALANLKPQSKDELDSFMYQTVGHQGVEFYSEAMGIPLFRHPTTGVALHHEKIYTPTPEDEVEDLYQLLLNVKEQIEIEAVAVGAILSDYQRIRVENVCSRLGLVALAYLWRRDQAELLQEMIDYNIDAIIIKVAALGLDPTKHLGMRISEIQPHLIKMSEKYGLNICGEGGEYETFTLDCPLFSKSLVIDDYETVIHSNDAIAPVGYINFRQLQLVQKPGFTESMTLVERIKGCPQKTAEDYVLDIDQADLTDTESDAGESDGIIEAQDETIPLLELEEPEPAPSRPTCGVTSGGWCWIGGLVGENENIGKATEDAVRKLECLLKERGFEVSHLVSVCLYVRDLSEFSLINEAYSRTITGPNPPVRICLGTGLNEKTPVILHCLSYAHKKNVLHVQSHSHWAPANIGPYSQAVRVGDIIYVAGQIGLVPGSMVLVSGGVKRQAKLALRHIARIIKAKDKEAHLRDVVQGVCFVTHPSFIPEARKEWEKRSNNAIMDYVVVKSLPRDALVEWQVWVHRGNTRFEYEEKGCLVNENRVSIRRRWNYDNTISAIVCHVSSVSSVSNPVISELGVGSGGSCESLTESQLVEVLQYAVSRLFKDFPAPKVVEGAVEESPTLGPPPVCSLQLFYRVGRSPNPTLIQNALGAIEEWSVAASLIPVAQLSHPNTFISISAHRHE